MDIWMTEVETKKNVFGKAIQGSIPEGLVVKKSKPIRFLRQFISQDRCLTMNQARAACFVFIITDKAKASLSRFDFILYQMSSSRFC